jgi:divalent metal cation (Fe/Co/Zn/Cd) transporter
MKIGLKLLLLWAASLTLFSSAGLATWLGLSVMDGVSGLIIRFFLGYCAIIVVSQVFSAIAEVGRLYRDISSKQPQSIRALLR